MDPTNKLAGFLLMSQGSLENRNFIELITEDDKQRVQSLLSSVSTSAQDESQTESAAACSLNVRLRDANSSTVSVQLFYSSFLDLDERKRHILGLIEDQEAGLGHRQLARIALQESTSHLCPADSTNSISADVVGRSILQADSLLTAQPGAPALWACEPSRAPSEGEESVGRSSMASDTADVVVWIDAFSKTYTVMKWSVAFTALAGGASPSDIRLLEWIRDEEAFECWVQSCINSFSNGDEPPEIQVKLRPPHLKHVYVSAKATMRSPDPDLEAPEDSLLERFPVQIVLSEITWHQDAKKRSAIIKGVGTPHLGPSSSMRDKSAGSRDHGFAIMRSEALPELEDSAIRHSFDGAADRRNMLLTL
eukprot:gnl/TRDRNA2_/TRDRNA2_176724_c2_seq1.p1 gnl/TRDRNA2_/TRDRNA2_176724_c2~~gnl/TRDRNA2_/TRDRNA2_176724_c2_seq1.p1  ORF type:complete len:399 (-),score=62.80 gnl/TRDRNA2_/TRDRNA2_176724_c2_seq1:125-1219(-)